MNKKDIKKTILIFLPILLLAILSLIALYNVDILKSSYKNYFIKQIIWYIVSFGTIITLFIKKEIVFKYSFYIYAFNILLLILVLLISTPINGARAWLRIGFISLQPSEIMKLSLLLYLSKVISQTKVKNLRDEIKLLIKVFIIILIPSVLVFLEPDSGAVVIYLIITLSLLIYSKVDRRLFLILSVIFIAIVTFFFLVYFNNSDLFIKLFGTSFFYRIDRLLNLKNMQIENALVAIGSSSFLGHGIKNIPLNIIEAPTDFVFSLLVSKIGFLGCLFLLIVYFIMLITILSRINNTKNYNVKLFTIGYFGMLFFQISYNILMNLGILPIMGITLPFISYGGSSLLTFTLGYTLVISFTKH